MLIDNLLELLGVTVVGVMGWFVRELWQADKELKLAIEKTREDLPYKYVLRDDYRRDIHEIKDMLTRLFDRLDAKADKPNGR